MNFKAEFIQVCSQFSEVFIQLSFHLFCNVVRSVSINRAVLSLFFDLHCGFSWMIYTLNWIRGTQRQFSENIYSEDDLRSRIFGTFVLKFLSSLPLLGFSNI